MIHKYLIIILTCFVFAGCQKSLFVELPVEESEIDINEVRWALNDYMKQKGLPKTTSVTKKGNSLHIRFAPASDQTDYTNDDVKAALETYISMPQIERKLIISFPDGIENAKPELIEKLDGKGQLAVEVRGNAQPELFAHGLRGDRVICAARLSVSPLLPSFELERPPQDSRSKQRQIMMELLGQKLAKAKLTYKVSMADGSDLPFDPDDIELETKYTGTMYTDDTKTDIYESYFRVFLGDLDHVSYSETLASKINRDETTYETGEESFRRCYAMTESLSQEKKSFLIAQNRPFTAAGEIQYK